LCSESQQKAVLFVGLIIFDEKLNVMKQRNWFSALAIVMVTALSACGPSGETIKGIYTYGDQVNMLEDCTTGNMYVISDQELEEKYISFNFEDPYVPVYVELKGTIREPKEDEAHEMSYIEVKEIITVNEDTSLCGQ